MRRSDVDAPESSSEEREGRAVVHWVRSDVEREGLDFLLWRGKRYQLKYGYPREQSEYLHPSRFPKDQRNEIIEWEGSALVYLDRQIERDTGTYEIITQVSSSDTKSPHWADDENSANWESQSREEFEFSVM